VLDEGKELARTALAMVVVVVVVVVVLLLIEE
jgi:hypothetical protein